MTPDLRRKQHRGLQGIPLSITFASMTVLLVLLDNHKSAVRWLATKWCTLAESQPKWPEARSFRLMMLSCLMSPLISETTSGQMIVYLKAVGLYDTLGFAVDKLGIYEGLIIFNRNRAIRSSLQPQATSQPIPYWMRKWELVSASAVFSSWF